MSRALRKTAVIFDLGKVIVDWDPQYLLTKIEPDPERLKFLSEVVLDLEWFREVDGGYPLSKAVAERSMIYPDYADQMQLYLTRWPETIGGLIEGTLDIVRELYNEGYSLYIVSNWANETWELVEDNFEFLSYFKDVIISGKVGVAKPDTAIFKMACDRFNVQPKTTIFIDDLPKNIEAAKALGFQAILFESPKTLRRDLAAINIL